MYNQTTLSAHSDYFKPAKQIKMKSKPFNRLVDIKKNHSEALLKFSKEVILTPHKGLAVLVLTDNPNKKTSFQYFLLQNAVQIKRNIYFNTLSLTPESQLYLEPTHNEEPKIISLKERIQVKQEKKKIDVQKVYGVNYQVYSNGDRLFNQVQNYFELIIVDQGQACIELNSREQNILSKNTAWLKFPRQSNHLTFKKDGMTTLITIFFEANGLSNAGIKQPIKLNYRQIQLISRIVNLATYTADKYPYYYDEMHSSLQLLLTQILNNKDNEYNEVTTSMRENYDNDLFQSIIDFLQENVGQQHQVNNLVNQFNISRSSLQSLFNKYTGKTPKQYINSLRLKQSKLLIHESKMTLSEIASKLGYGSIQYFSRAFSKEFGLSPSNYAKSIMKRSI